VGFAPGPFCAYNQERFTPFIQVVAMLDKLGSLLQSKTRPYKLLQIEPSLECNLECVMCPWSELRPDTAQMSWDTFACIAENFHLAGGVDFTGGGEPTSNPRLPDMVRVAKEAGCEVGFSTNGTLLDRGLAGTLVSLNQEWICFSVDAATAETYERIRQGAEFETVMRNIQTLHDIKINRHSKVPRMMMVFVMMHENFHELPIYVDLAHELGVEQITFKNLDVILKDGDDERRLFSHDGPPLADVEPVMAEAQKRAKKLGIGLRLYALQPKELTICEQDPLHNLFFNWAGYVSPCITLSYAESRVFDGNRHFVPCQRFGNINDEPLGQIWNNIAYQEFRRPYEIRLRLGRQATINALIGGEEGESLEMLPAPAVCRTCYYLYGI
jgi:MoaA/NifB/PqqE/SkfB family radical SAM enzyme